MEVLVRIIILTVCHEHPLHHAEVLTGTSYFHWSCYMSHNSQNYKNETRVVKTLELPQIKVNAWGVFLTN